MNWNAVAFDWNQVRAFLATVEEGSLSAAARALGQTQPTLSRQVSSLEQALGVTLFERGPRTMALTQTGLELLEHVRTMGDAATRISLSASGQSQAIDGHVSITASDMIATHVLAGAVARIREAAPGIDVELATSNEIRDLVQREADIAVRHVQPDQSVLIARRIRTASAYLYASEAFLARMGTPRRPDDLTRFAFVGLSPMERFLPSVHMQGLKLELKQFGITAGSGATLIELVRQGLGVGILPEYAAVRFPDLVPILKNEVAFPVPIWLVTHRELHTSRRIRLVFDMLAQALAEA